ncbi:conjugal transfer protein TraC, partial [Patescibacteria group bacterium]|nr:conjugal transfer protein TraC [Patescibacteria group bacterium]MBU1951736.1 conjugal transfer protein TraC [Patescibacteria group bacterium]
MVQLFKKVDIKEDDDAKEEASLKKAEHQRERAQEEKEILEAERSFQHGVVSVRDLIAPSAFKVDSRFVQLGTKFVSTVFVVTYPRYISVGWFAPVINLNIPMDVAMYFYPVKPEAIL